jgi:hypothetical protein
MNTLFAGTPFLAPVVLEGGGVHATGPLRSGLANSLRLRQQCLTLQTFEASAKKVMRQRENKR